MSFEPPAGILDIGNATLRVGKLEVAETSGLNQGLQNIIKNDLLITENTTYAVNHKWGLKLPTTWVGEFEVKGHSGKYIDFNFYNENSASNAQGYNLTFKDTTMTLRYDGGNPLPITGDTVDSTLSLGDAGYGEATIPTIVGAFRKVNIFFERGVISVSIDGTRYLYFKETDGYNQGLGVASRVVSTTGSAFVNLFIESDNENNSAFKNLRIVNGRFISDKTSNIAFMGGNLGVGVNSPKETLDIRGNMHLTRVSNVSQIKVDSNVVTEYTGPHDRPLRKYPEVAFPLSTSSESAASGATTFTYKGYTVTSNSVYSGTAYKISNAFDGTATSWSGNLGDYDSNGDVASGRTANYLQIQLPNAIKLENIKITSEANYEYANGPRNITLYGSNNGSNWVTLKTETDLPLDGGTTNPDPQTAVVHVNTTTKYLYYKLEISKIYISSGNATYARIGEWELYGYEEGGGSLDTTLKTVYNVPATTGTQLEVYYDAKDLTTMPSTVTDLAGGDQNGAVSGHSPTLDETNGIESFKFDGVDDYIESTLTNDSGAWIFSKSLWFKQTTGVPGANYSCMSSIGDYSVSDATFFYLNDTHILVSIYSSGVYFPSEWVVNEWTHAVVVMKGTTSSINDIELYINGKKVEAKSQFGTATTRTLPANAQLRVGREVGSGTSYFTGSIANFRLYSKALNADQVKELYDYQKDYFLGSKSQVTLYKGHLGVGVTEPSSQLELAGDERIQEYPPRDMTNPSTYIEGHGVFKAYGFQPHASYPAWRAFSDRSSVWWSDALSEYSGTGDYSGSTRLAPETVKGAYIVLEMPYEIVLKQIKFWQQINGSHVWDRGVYYAKCNPTDEWTAIHNVTDRPADDDTPYVAYITDPRPYKYFAIVITRRHTADATSGVSIRDLQFFGTPGPTTLDKGSLTLGRSLDVPRVSRYDVDTETPRPEKLLVDFDTTVNSSPTDISGKGNHGAFYGDAQYSAGDKAFKFDGADDYIQTGTVGLSGTNPVFSVSLWVNYNGGGSETLCMIGDAYNNGTTIWLDIEASNKPRIIFVNNDVSFTDPNTGLGAPLPNVWNHLVYVFNGTPNGGRSAYVNGVKQVASAAVGTLANGNLVLPSSSKLTIGALDHTSGFIHETVGQISNFKLYSVALEPSEVKKLYNLGRTGRSMVISDTAVGIGKVPEAQLDVRGIIKGQSPAVFIAKANAAMTATAASAIALFGTVITDTAGGWDSVNHRYYAKVPGFYIVNASQFTIVTTNVYVVIRIDKNGVEYSSTTGFAGPGGYPNTSLMALIYLSVGDYVRCRIGTDTNRTTASGHRLEIVHVGM